MIQAFLSSVMPSFCLRWWLDCDPAARWWLSKLWPQLEGVQGRFWWPTFRVLAGQWTHTWTEHPGRLQSPHPPRGLEQQAQTCPVPELQVGVKHQHTQKCMHSQMFLSYNTLVFVCAQFGRRSASVPSPCVRLQRDGAGLFQLVPRQTGFQHSRQWQHLCWDLP